MSEGSIGTCFKSDFFELFSHPHLTLELHQIGALLRHRNVVVFALLLGQQLEPTVDGVFQNLRNSKRQRPHEVVPRGAIPVPDLDQDPAVLVLGFEITVEIRRNESQTQTANFTEDSSNLQRNGFVPHRIQRRSDGFCFLLHVIRVWNELDLDVRIAGTVRIHWNQVASLFYCG